MLDTFTVLTLYCTTEAAIVAFSYYEMKKQEANHTPAESSPLVKEKQI
jgi:hypothetical protein